MTEQKTREELEKEWWDAWWIQDYSWDGLAKKEWVGWYKDSDNGTPYPVASTESPNSGAQKATLQDYWRSEKIYLIKGIDGKYYTRFHMPFSTRTGSSNNNYKNSWDNNTWETFYSDLATFLNQAKLTRTKINEISEISGADYRAQMQGVVLQDFQYSKFEKIIKIDELSANFHNSYWKGRTNLENTKVLDGTDFSNACFDDDLAFEKSTFVLQAIFRDSLWLESATFSDCTFLSSVDFSRSTFLNVVYFEGSHFNNQTLFQNVYFAGGASFNEAIFKGETYFCDAKVCDGIDFNQVFFLKNTSFRKLQVQSELFITNSIIMGKFNAEGNNRSALIGKFDGTLFANDTIFQDRHFLAGSSFQNTYFGGLAEFHGTIFHEGTNWHNTNFDLVFNNKNGYSFATNIGLEKQTELLAEFETLGRSHRLKFGKKISKRKYSLDSSSKIDPNISFQSNRYARVEQSFRKLKLAMEEVRNKSLEQEFYSKEIRARRNRRDSQVKYPERFLSKLYEVTSNYGNAILLPLFYTLISVFVFAAIYYALIDKNALFWGEKWDPDFIKSLGFSLTNSFPFVGMKELRDSYFFVINTKGNNEIYSLRGWMIALAIIQSIFSLSMLFLSGLAIRRRFQIS